MCLVKTRLLWLGICLFIHAADGAHGTFVKSLRIFYNNSLQEQHKCTALELDPEHEDYIVSFNPDTDSRSILHLSVQVCEGIPTRLRQWSCSGEVPGCVGSIRPVYVWGPNSTTWNLPYDTGIPIGGESGGRFLILQAHVRAITTGGAHSQDYAAVAMELITKRPTYECGLMVLGNIGYIPPTTRNFVSNSACLWGSSQTALMIGYRIHTQGLGVWVSGYRFRGGFWRNVAAGRPQHPENVIPTTTVTLLSEGDAIISRCFYDNPGSSRVHFGPNSDDEMCNLQLIYIFPFGVDPGLRFQTCAQDAQNFHLIDYFDYIPNENLP